MQTDHRDQRQDWITNRGVAVQRFYLSWLRAKGLWSTLPMTNMWLHIPPTVSVPWLPKAEDLKVHFRDCLVVFVHTNGWNCKNLLYNILFVQKCGSWVVQLSICIYIYWTSSQWLCYCTCLNGMERGPRKVHLIGTPQIEDFGSYSSSARLLKQDSCSISSLNYYPYRSMPTKCQMQV